MDIKDVRATKMARAAFIKHGIDISMADVRVTYGLCSIRGRIKRYPKMNIDNLEKETAKIIDILKKMADIKDVYAECTYEEKYF